MIEEFDMITWHARVFSVIIFMKMKMSSPDVDRSNTQRNSFNT